MAALTIVEDLGVLEQRGRLSQELLLPSPDLARVDFELAGQLGRGLVAPDRRQSHLGLECRPQYPTLPSHPRRLQAGPSDTGKSTLSARPVFGVHYSLRKRGGAQNDLPGR